MDVAGGAKLGIRPRGWFRRCRRRRRNVSLPRSFPALLAVQIALRMAVEVHTVHGATGATLQQAVLRQMGAVQRSYQAAAAAAAAAGVVDE